MITRVHFQKNLKDLKMDVLLMEGLVEEAVKKAIHALVKNDQSLVAKVIKDDEVINKKELFIENQYVILLATDQPPSPSPSVISVLLYLS